jgi:uncharacterized phage protein (TIGR01671 family)
MKEKKFRVWDEKRKNMVYFGFSDVDGGTTSTDGDWSKFIELNHNPVTEYIGLKDKNGKEIYEGDGVKGNYAEALHFGTIEWWKEYLCWGFKRYKWMNKYGEMTKGKEIGGGGLNLYLLKNLEIIGNIHENPELLK